MKDFSWSLSLGNWKYTHLWNNLSCNYDDQLSSNFHWFVILCICWETPSENTGLWQCYQMCPVPLKVGRSLCYSKCVCLVFDFIQFNTWIFACNCRWIESLMSIRSQWQLSNHTFFCLILKLLIYQPIQLFQQTKIA